MVASIDTVLGLCLIGLTALLHLARRDAWPFTRYPMFSRYKSLKDVRVMCLALEGSDGRLRWWRPHFYRYTDGIGGKLADLSDANISSCTDHVLRLLTLEREDLSRCRAIHVIERKWENGVPCDRTVSAIPLKGGLHKHCG